MCKQGEETAAHDSSAGHTSWNTSLGLGGGMRKMIAGEGELGDFG